MSLTTADAITVIKCLDHDVKRLRAVIMEASQADEACRVYEILQAEIDDWMPEEREEAARQR